MFRVLRIQEISSDNVKAEGSTRLGDQARPWEVGEGFLEEVTLELKSEA